MNQAKYLEQGRIDLAHAWSLVRLSLEGIESNHVKQKAWRTNPMGRGIITKLLRGFEQQRDLHSIAELSAVVFAIETRMNEAVSSLEVLITIFHLYRIL